MISSICGPLFTLKEFLVNIILQRLTLRYNSGYIRGQPFVDSVIVAFRKLFQIHIDLQFVELQISILDVGRKWTSCFYGFGPKCIVHSYPRYKTTGDTLK